MPNMDGLELVNRIRQTDKLTPLIMASTESDKGRVMEAIRAGVNSYVIKPFTPEVLIEKVKQTLHRRKVA
jgi:two-component system chemotaxis response regulator CheY